MAKKIEGKALGVTAETGRNAYEASVEIRMRGRAGSSSPKGAAGNAFEIMANDEKNGFSDGYRKPTELEISFEYPVVWGT